MKELTLFDSNNHFSFDLRTDGEMVNITDLWKANGSIEMKAPKYWLRQESTKGFVLALCKLQKVTENHLINIKRGKNGGTWVHKLIASEYAQYLSPELAVMVNQVFFERIAEEKNPDLIIDRAINTYKRKGKDDKWIGKRIEGKIARNGFTSTLASHGVEREGFRDCSNKIYDPLFGGPACVVRHKLSIEKKDSIRDNLSTFQLDCVKFAEALATENIINKNITGNAGCVIASFNASTIVAKAVIDSRKNLNTL